MELIQLTYDLTAIDGMLPVYLQEQAKKRKLLLFGGQNTEGQLMSFAAFSVRNQSQTELKLEYFYTAPDFRGRGCVVRLLELCLEFLAKKGASAVICKICEEEEKARDYYDLLLHVGFKPVSFHGQLLVFSAEKILDAAQLEKLSEAAKKKVAVMAEVRDGTAARRLRAEAEQIGALNRTDTVKPENVYLYLENGQIKCLLVMEKLSDTEVILSKIWVSPDCKTGYELLYVLSCITDQIRKMGLKDGTVYLQADSGVSARLMEKVFGASEKVYGIQEYVCALKKRFS